MLRLAGAAAAVMASDKLFTELKEGVILNEYPVVVKPEKKVGEMELLSSEILGYDGGVLLTSEGKLIFEPNPDPSESFFVPHKIYNYVHRVNRDDVIRRAFEEGANLFDIDISNAKNEGNLYAEHGLVPSLNLKLGRRAVRFHLPLVIDVNERGLTLGDPNHPYREAVKLIADLGRQEGRRVGISAEVKRGYLGPDELYQIFETHHDEQISVLLHAKPSYNLEAVGRELASFYNTAG